MNEEKKEEEEKEASVEIPREKEYTEVEPSEWTEEMTAKFYSEHPECYQEYYQQLVWHIQSHNYNK